MLAMFRLQTEESLHMKFTSLEMEVALALAVALAVTCMPCSQLVVELLCCRELPPLLFDASHL